MSKLEFKAEQYEIAIHNLVHELESPGDDESIIKKACKGFSNLSQAIYDKHLETLLKVAKTHYSPTYDQGVWIANNDDLDVTHTARLDNMEKL